MELRALAFRQNLKILSMFLVTQFLGLILAAEVYNGAQVVQETGVQAGQSISYALSYIAAIIIFTGVLVLIIRHFKTNKIFIFIEALAVGGASFIVFLIVLSVITNNVQNELYGNGSTMLELLALLMAAGLILAKNKWPRLRNATSIIASAGLGLIIGINLSFTAVYVFMIILAIYDFIAVFITKHMVTMGNAMYNMNLAFLVGTNDAEALPRHRLSREELGKLTPHRAAFEKQGSLLKDLDRQKLVPMVARRALGNGDLAVPLMAAVSAYRISWSFVPSLVVVVGATAGLIATFMILNRYKRALPAIPPLFIGITLAMLVYLFIL